MRQLTMRLAVGATIAVTALVSAILLAGCSQNTAHDGAAMAAAARSRAQVVPAVRELYRALFEASAQSVDLLDWGYEPCGTGTAALSYGISLRLFAFTDRQDTDFGAFRHQAVSIVRSAGWTLQQRPPTRSQALPTVPSAYYRLSGRENLSGRLGLVGDVNPLVGVTGTLSVNSPCFDADGAAGRLQTQPGSTPLPTRPAPGH